MDVRRTAMTATLTLGMTVAAASPALAAPPLNASCHGQFNGYINPLYKGTGQINAEGVASLKGTGLNAGGFTREEAHIHGEDCASVPEGFPAP
jgi:hypothetical protein